jgi:hypothetical protein
VLIALALSLLGNQSEAIFVLLGYAGASEIPINIRQIIRKANEALALAKISWELKPITNVNSPHIVIAPPYNKRGPNLSSSIPTGI